jgi:cyanate lyase
MAAGCLGQMTFSAEQAAVPLVVLGLPAEVGLVLQTRPNRGSLPRAVPSDPLIYRFYELVSVYGSMGRHASRSLGRTCNRGF